VAISHPRRTNATPVYLTALVAMKNTLELRTALLSQTALASVLGEHVAAITLSSPGCLNLEKLLGGFLKESDLFEPVMPSRTRGASWRCYALASDQKQLQLKQRVKFDQLGVILMDIAGFVATPRSPAPVCALVPEMDWTAREERAVQDALYDVILSSATGDLVCLELKSISGHEPSDRQSLLRVRKELLDKVGAFTSEDIAAAAGSTTVNPSQLAADQRRAGRVFGVKFGQSWHYPKFQFDAGRNTIPEMKDVLTALPDEQGWDRLQWFLEPHEKLRGRTPLEVWKTDRRKVVDAANTERWDGRD
jgi:hypothetical protein